MSGCDLGLRVGKWKENGKFMLGSLGCTTNCLMTILRLTYAAYFPYFTMFTASPVDGARTRDGISGGAEVQ